jgi:hypothetical protein
MKLLLTSGGVTNPSIRDALIDLLGKPIAESTALCIPTAQWGHPVCGPASVRGFVVGEPPWLHGSSLRRNTVTCPAAQPSLQPTAARKRSRRF